MNIITSPPATLSFAHHESPVGPLTLVASEHGLRAVLWPDDSDGRVRFSETMVEDPAHPVLVATATQLDEYFLGARTTFDIALDLVGTEFQVEAWGALCSIDFGATKTYAEQAARIGRPKAVRAIGSANGKNPVSIVVPCHRVVGADGSMTGFAGGIDTKRFLLDHEQAVVDKRADS